ncbi:MAG: C39 family peptidase [Nocardioidaceae bacterium]
MTMTTMHRGPDQLRGRGRRLLALLVAGALPLALAAASPSAVAGSGSGGFRGDASTTPTDFHAWTSLEDFAGGHTSGGATVTGKGGGALTLQAGSSYGTWTSPSHQTGFGISELIASWQAGTPGDSWMTTQLSVQVGSTWSPWYTMGKWAFTTEAIRRTSVPDQNDDFGYISIDTYFTHSGDHAAAYRLRAQLYGSAQSRPTVREVAAVAFDPQRPTYHPSDTTMQRTVDLQVPQYSQETHRKEYARFGGGGEAWCSPTSTEMVVEYWGRGPSRADLESLPPDKVFDRHGRKDGSVDWAAIHTYDKNYGGTGNWPFNTAYAAHYGLDASVRQYDSLQALEYWVKRGVPTVVSIAWDNKSKDQRLHLDGADIDSTGGHLMVVRGFTAEGEVIANDPASPTNKAVRHVYQRDQFEFVWLHASAGVVYLIKPYSIAG